MNLWCDKCQETVKHVFDKILGYTCEKCGEVNIMYSDSTGDMNESLR